MFQAYNQHCVVSDGRGISAADSESDAGDLYLVPGQVKVYFFSFLPEPEDVGKVLEVSTIIWLSRKIICFYINTKLYLIVH